MSGEQILFKFKSECVCCNGKTRYYIYNYDKYYECKIKPCECDNVFITIYRAYDVRGFGSKLPTKITEKLESLIDNSEKGDNQTPSESDPDQKETELDNSGNKVSNEQNTEASGNDFYQLQMDITETVNYSECMEE